MIDPGTSFESSDPYNGPSGAGPVGQDVNAYGAGPYYVPPTPPSKTSDGTDGTTQTYTQVGSGGGAYDLTGFDAGAVAEAQQEAYDFGQILGWPKWYDAAAIEKDILQADMQADTNQAYQFIWSLLKPDQQKDNPNAYFGLTKQQYTEKLNNLKDMFEMYTGSDSVPDDIRNKALRENWTQTELMNALEKDPTVGATAPWLIAGQTFRDVQAQFTQLYGQAPAGPSQLGSWWKFRAGAQSVLPGGPAQIAANPPPALVSRQLTADVATR